MSIRSFALASVAAMGLSAAMRGFDYAAPALGGFPTLRVVNAPEYDGLGRKKAKPVHPRHNAKRRTREWQSYAARVVSTHSDRPDPRDDKYLHAAARRRRSALMAAAA